MYKGAARVVFCCCCCCVNAASRGRDRGTKALPDRVAAKASKQRKVKDFVMLKEESNGEGRLRRLETMLSVGTQATKASTTGGMQCLD
jgi:hypothetical protein